MSEKPEEGSPEPEPSLDESSYTATGSDAGRHTRRRLFAAVAAAVFVVTCAAGFVYSRTDGTNGDLNETTAATEPEATEPEGPTTATTTEAPDPEEPLCSAFDDLEGEPTTSTSTASTTDPPRTTTSTLPLLECPPDRPTTDPFTMPPERERTPPDEDEAPPADAPLAERVEFAWRVGYLGNVEHRITTDSRYGGMTDEVWGDDSTGVWRTLTTGGTGTLAGKPILDHGAAGFEGTTPKGQREVDFCFSEYMEWTPGPLVMPETQAHRIREDLDGGLLVEDGREVVDGRDTVRLRRTDYTSLMWLDAATLLPIRTSGTWPTGGDFSTTHEFIPRTDETRKLIVPPIPEGFTKVEQTRGDGASIEAGCQ